MKKLAILSLVAVLSASCNAQEKHKSDISEHQVNPLKKEEAKGTWKVDKEVDENGNIIRYDSIYSWSSGNDIKGFEGKDRDSLLQSAHSMFSRHFATTGSHELPDFFQNDSLLINYHFSDDLFEQHFGHDFPNIEEIRKKMEDIQRQFIEERQRPLIPAVPEKEDSGRG